MIHDQKEYSQGGVIEVTPSYTQTAWMLDVASRLSSLEDRVRAMLKQMEEIKESGS